MSMQNEDERFDATLRDHLAGELDPQRGRALQAFQQHVAQQHHPQPPGRGGRLFIYSAVGTAMAASLAALWAVPRFVAPKPPDIAHTQPAIPAPVDPLTPQTSPSAAATGWEQVDRVVRSRTVNNSLVLLEDQTPARIVRQVTMERTQWFDPERGVRVETVVPREKVTLIAMDTY